MDPSNVARTNGGFDCEFVKKPKELQNECSVCLLVLREPLQTSCCGYSFCQICIERIQATTVNPVCPLCKKEFNTYPNKWLKRELYQLNVYCTHRKEGCEWVGPLGQLDEHLNSDAGTDNLTNGCGFVPLKCHACNKSVPRKGLRVHTSDLCEQRPFSCEYCGEYDSKYLDVINNHQPRCPCYPVECVNKCGSCPRRKDLRQHISDECRLTSIPCELCSVPVLRGEMNEHIVANLITHISLLVNEKLHEADEKIRELRQENQYLQDDVEKLRLQVGKNKEEISRLREDNLETQSLYSEMRQQNDELMKNYDDLQEDYDGIQENYDGLRADYDSLRVECEDLKQENDQLQAKVEQLSDNIKLTNRGREFKADDQRCLVGAKIKRGSRRNLDEYDDSESTASQSDSDSSQTLGAVCRPVRSSTRQDEQTSIPPVILKMSNYSSYLKSAETWESEPFYSNRRPSYKLCLSVRASRSGSLSMYVCLMRGDYDDRLNWPLNADITVQLVNRGRGNDWERKILCRDGHRVTKQGTAGKARGGSNFFRLHESTSFIKDNTLWFKVVNVIPVNRREYSSWRS